MSNKSPKKKLMGFMATPQEKARIENLAHEHAPSVSQFVRDAIQHYTEALGAPLYIRQRQWGGQNKITQSDEGVSE